MAAKTILLLSDGRPGHFRQSEAIVLALSRRMATTVERVELIKPRIVPRRLARYAALWLPPRFVLRWLYGLSAVPKADIIVSAGGNTLAANIALSALTVRREQLTKVSRWCRTEQFRPLRSGGDVHRSRR